ncbi:hypothetical protein SFUMM280S_11211 [Streptomyces fumanus]
MPTLTARRTAAAATAAVTALVLTACGNPTDGGTTEVAATTGTKAKIDLSPDQHRITTAKVDSIAARVPEKYGSRGS